MTQSHGRHSFLLEADMLKVWSTFLRTAVTFYYATMLIASPVGAHQIGPCHSRASMEIDYCQ